MRRLMQKHRNVSANGRCLVWIPTAMGQSIRTLSDALRDAKLIGSYCMEYETSQFGRTSSYPLGIWREAEALAVDLSEGKPRALEVHIFPDGHAEAAITRGYSPPRLQLDRTERFQRPGVQHTYPDCTDDQLKTRGR
jgi:hypothetical protein